MGKGKGENVSDQRVLGGEEFVRHVLHRSEQKPAVAKLPLEELLQRVAHHFDLPAELLRQRKRSRSVAEARSVVCYFAAREMGISGELVGRMLNISRAAVSYAADRGEVLVAENQRLREKIWTLI
jgi:chromosomal replication initiation ATPase DnaA